MISENIYLRETMRREAYKGFAEAYRLPERTMASTMDRLEKSLETLESGACHYIFRTKSECDGIEKTERLKIDYARLFVGPFRLHAPPYGSVYLENKRIVMGDSTMDVVRRYGDAGLACSGQFKEAPDHVAVELEFMYCLIFREIESLAEGDVDAAMDSLFRQKSFLEDHIGRWVPSMAEKVEKFAATGFYRNLAAATGIFIAEEFKRGLER